MGWPLRAGLLLLAAIGISGASPTCVQQGSIACLPAVTNPQSSDFLYGVTTGQGGGPGGIGAHFTLNQVSSAGNNNPVFNTISAGNLPINVKGAPYNAKCDGTTDDTTAIQSAINAGVASGNSFTLYFPAGICKTTSVLTIAAALGQSVAIKGENRAASQILVTGGGDGFDITMNPSQADNSGRWFSGLLDISGLTINASATGGTAIKATGISPNSGSPKIYDMTIGYKGTGSFLNGISISSMSFLFVHDITVASANATGIAFQLDGNSTFPSIVNNFSNIYLWNFAVGLQFGNGTTSYVQGISVTNAQFGQNNQTCLLWNNATTGFLGDQLLVSNSFCNGGIVVNNVEDVVIQGNYILSSTSPQIGLTTVSSGLVSGNTLNSNNNPVNGIAVTNSHVGVNGNSFIAYGATGSAPVVFAAGTVGNTASDNRCDGCVSTQTIVNDLSGNNFYSRNVNNGYTTPSLGLMRDNFPVENTSQQTWLWQTPSSPTFLLEGTVMGWNYAGQGEADTFLSRGLGGAHGYSELWYDTTSGSVGNQLMGLTIDGNLVIPGVMQSFASSPSHGVNLPVTTVSALQPCNSGLQGNLQAVSDATAPTYNATLTGGGSVSIPVYCNGSAWTAH